MDRNLNRLPENIDDHEVATFLHLFCNKLPDLPKSIGLLTNLTKLELDCHNLISLPASNYNLSKLNHLIVLENRPVALPEVIYSLTNLTYLDLDCHQTTELSESIGNLSNLTNLTINSNALVALPDNICNLNNLSDLNLNCNQITKLPESLGNLSRLHNLNINGNSLMDLSMLRSIPHLHVRFLTVGLPRRYWTKFSEWKSEWLLDEDNAGVRCILIECIGYEKICQDLDAVTLDTWREYTLLKIDGVENVYEEIGFDEEVELIGTEQMMLLKMTCPSTAHIHILRVPPEITSAEAAITWVNHGIHPDRIAFAT